MIKLDRVTAYTLREAAEIMHVSYQTVRKLVLSGKLRAQKVGRMWYVTDKTLEEFILGEAGTPSVVSSSDGEEVR